MSESQEDAEKKKAEEQKKREEAQTSQESQPTAKPSAPQVGTPIQSRPRVGTPIGEKTAPTVGTPVGAKPTVGTPVGAARPTVGTPVGRPTVGTTAATQGSPQAVVSTAPPTPRPIVSTPVTPSTPAKPGETKESVSRRNFLKGLAILGGIVAVGQFAALGPYLQGSVGLSSISSQVIQDIQTGKSISTTDVPENSWTTFVYPRTGNPNIDNDTFRQCVLIHLPKGWTAPSSLSAVDPISKDTFVALSRVCVHLWCLWSYIPSDDLGICPCHGSQYVPGGVPGSQGALNPGLAVGGPASLQTPPNNQLPVITIKIASDGVVSATGVVGQIGCGQHC